MKHVFLLSGKFVLNNVYLYPHLGGIDFKLFRLAGPGLGNSLFPWARCVVDSKKYNVPMISSMWFNIKPGAWIRNEKDKRTYHGIFHSNIYEGFHSQILFFMCKKISEENLSDVLEKNKKKYIVVYKGHAGFFSKILNDYLTIKNELNRKVKDKHNGVRSDIALNKSIVVHVRMGDFKKTQVDGPDPEQNNQRLPMWWYKEKILQLKKNFPDAPIYIFSDGSNEELSILLSEGNCHRVYNGSSISDILSISQAAVFIASSSTFSMWASYLGRMPVIWFPGQMRQRLYVDDYCSEIESGKNEILPEAFISSIKKRMSFS